MMKSLRGFWKSLKEFITIKTFADKKESAKIKKDSKNKIGIIRKKGLIKIYVGLDFGTACTKIAYSVENRNNVNPLIFNHNCEPTYPCFSIPSIGAINKNKKLLLGIEAAQFLKDKPWNDGLKYLKVVVAGKYEPSFKDAELENNFFNYIERNCGSHDAFTPEQVTALFLAYSIRRTRKTLKSKPEYKDNDFDITFNVCVPIEHIENNNVWQEFKHIIAWAELIEKEWIKQGDDFDPISFSKEIEKDANYGEKDTNSFDRIDTNSRVYAVPESVAGVASYLRSSQKQGGLHALIDFGSGTIDISIFNLLLPTRAHPELESKWYAASNIPLGTNKIERLISNHSENINNYSSSEINNIIQKLSSEQFEDGKLFREVIKELNFWLKKTDNAWSEAFKHLRNHSAFKKVPVFVSGGGSELPMAKKIFSCPPIFLNIEDKFSVENLPVPEDYNSINGLAPFNRMAIAYGLTIRLPRLDAFVLPKDAPDDTPPPLPVKDWFEPWW